MGDCSSIRGPRFMGDCSFARGSCGCSQWPVGNDTSNIQRTCVAPACHHAVVIVACSRARRRADMLRVDMTRSKLSWYETSSRHLRVPGKRRVAGLSVIVVIVVITFLIIVLVVHCHRVALQNFDTCASSSRAARIASSPSLMLETTPSSSGPHRKSRSP